MSIIGVGSWGVGLGKRWSSSRPHHVHSIRLRLSNVFLLPFWVIIHMEIVSCSLPREARNDIPGAINQSYLYLNRQLINAIFAAITTTRGPLFVIGIASLQLAVQLGVQCPKGGAIPNHD